jgi:hypothetical protein
MIITVVYQFNIQVVQNNQSVNLCWKIHDQLIFEVTDVTARSQAAKALHKQVQKVDDTRTCIAGKCRPMFKYLKASLCVLVSRKITCACMHAYNVITLSVHYIHTHPLLYKF